MTDEERDECRKLQDVFLAHPRVQAEIEEHGWDEGIMRGGIGPSYRTVKEVLLPQWKHVLVEFFRNNPWSF